MSRSEMNISASLGVAIREFPLTTGFADYLLYIDGRAAGVIEAKPVGHTLLGVEIQSDKYVRGLPAAVPCHRRPLPFAYQSTGDRTRFTNDLEPNARSREVFTFHRPEELLRLAGLERQVRERLANFPPLDPTGLWHVQADTIRNLERSLGEGRPRALIQMATGSGKTFTAVNICHRLIKHGGAQRILFLVDRNNLGRQTLHEFQQFVSPQTGYKFTEEYNVQHLKSNTIAPAARVCITTIQRLFSMLQGETEFREENEEQSQYEAESPLQKQAVPIEYNPQFPINTFDFIIIDECHRGGASDESTWRAILEYFSPAVQLGLTATPKRKDNADTYAYFGEPVYVYSLKQGINDGFLTPFRLKQISTTLDEYVYTADDEVIQGEVEEGKRYGEPEFNRVIEIKAREEYRVKLFMGMIDQSEKTLVFCATQDHALAVRDLINQNKTSTNPNYCVRVTANDGEIGDKHLRAFQDNEKTIPTILTTSQKLSTGVDARNVRNIILMRPVNSMIEFKQIIGRGTRLFDGKDYFTIYDFVKAHEHFNDPEWDGEPEPPEPIVIDGEWITDEEGVRKPRDRRPREGDAEPRPEKIKVRLADGKVRTIQCMVATSFWSADGRPMSSAQFLESLFGALPDFFADENELRRIWGDPETRRSLLAQLEAKGFSRDHMAEMQRIIAAEKSDLFDVLAFVAFALPPVTRQLRAEHAREEIQGLGAKRRAFVEFVLGQYVAEGVEELDPEKLPELLRLKYRGAIADAIADLGPPDEIRRLFAEFQKHLYQEAA